MPDGRRVTSAHGVLEDGDGSSKDVAYQALECTRVWS